MDEMVDAILFLTGIFVASIVVPMVYIVITDRDE